ncbi:MAG: S-layer homology domain-containing protein [Coprothermobacterota bacterium]|nr:S-layer homology domain-containing protein [Coprothermobacterota bacterium]
MMHRVGFVLFLVLVLLGSSLAVSPLKAVQANIGPVSSHGEGIEPLEGGEGVRMTAEQVTIRLFDFDPRAREFESKESQRYARLSYRCVFQMKNTTQEESDLQVGFPLFSSNPQYSTLQEVRVLLDGETVPYETLTRTETVSSGYQLKAQWAVWPVSFQPEQGREIEVTYTMTANRGMERIRIDYSLRTGAAWAGTIGQSLIEFSAPFPIEDGQVSASPTGWVLENGTVHWDLRDFEPAEDVNVSLISPEAWQPIHEAKAALDLEDTPVHHLAVAKAYLALAQAGPFSGDEGFFISLKQYRQWAEVELNSAFAGDSATEAAVLWTGERAELLLHGEAGGNWEEILSGLRSHLSADPGYIGSHLRLYLEEVLFEGSFRGLDLSSTLEEALRTQPEAYLFSSFYRHMTGDLGDTRETTTPALPWPLVQMVEPVRIRTVIGANLAGERTWDFTFRLDRAALEWYTNAWRANFYPIARLETDKDFYHLRLRLPFPPDGLARAQSNLLSELLTRCPTAYPAWELGLPSWALEPLLASNIQLTESNGRRQLSESLEAGELATFLAAQKTALEKARAFWSGTPSRTDSSAYMELKMTGSPTVCQGVADLIRQDLDLALHDFPSMPWKVQEEIVFTDEEGNPVVRETRELDLAQPGPQGFSVSAPLARLDLENHWAEETIRSLMEDGLVTGFPGGNVQPDQPIRRGESAKLFCLTNGLHPEPFPAEGQDMSSSHWAAPWLTRLAEEESLRQGMVWPASTGAQWHPDEPITRREAAIWLVNLLGGVDAATDILFPDVGTGDPAVYQIYQAHELGLIEGYPDGTFRPDAFLTRAEAFIIVQRLQSLFPTSTLANSGVTVDVWEQLPSIGGTVWNLAFDPSNPQTLYAGTYDRGVFKSSDGGTSWIASSSGLTNTWVRCLVIDPSNPQILYASTYGGGVFKSTNGGATWASSSSEPMNSRESDVRCLVIDSNNPQTLYAGTFGYGIWKSTNGGATWIASSSGLTNNFVRCLVIDSNNPQILYVSTENSGGVCKSSDGGTSWTASSSGLEDTWVRCLVIDPNNPQILYAGTENHEIWKSSDGGVNWAASSSGLADGTVYSLAINPGNSQILYAGTESHGIWKSSDGGVNWAASSSELTNIWVQCLAFAPSGTLYAVTENGLFWMTP